MTKKPMRQTKKKKERARAQLERIKQKTGAQKAEEKMTKKSAF